MATRTAPPSCPWDSLRVGLSSCGAPTPTLAQQTLKCHPPPQQTLRGHSPGEGAGDSSQGWPLSHEILGKARILTALLSPCACSSDHWLTALTRAEERGLAALGRAEKRLPSVCTWAASCLPGPLSGASPTFSVQAQPGLPMPLNALGTGTDRKPPLRTCSRGSRTVSRPRVTSGRGDANSGSPILFPFPFPLISTPAPCF